MKFEKTLKEVRDSLNASPMNFTRRDHTKVSNILKDRRESTEMHSTPIELRKQKIYKMGLEAANTPHLQSDSARTRVISMP